MNKFLQTIIIAPMITKSHKYPTRVKLKFEGKTGWIVLDQIQTVDRRRIVKKLGTIDAQSIMTIKETLKEMLVD